MSLDEVLEFRLEGWREGSDFDLSGGKRRGSEGLQREGERERWINLVRALSDLGWGETRRGIRI